MLYICSISTLIVLISTGFLRDKSAFHLVSTAGSCNGSRFGGLGPTKASSAAWALLPGLLAARAPREHGRRALSATSWTLGPPVYCQKSHEPLWWLQKDRRRSPSRSALHVRAIQQYCD